MLRNAASGGIIGRPSHRADRQQSTGFVCRWWVSVKQQARARTDK